MYKILSKKSLPSFCTSNFDVLKVLMIFSKYHQLPTLIESTSNQVNQFGGYTGLKPLQFKQKVDKLCKSVKLPSKLLIIGGDHLGPLPWKNVNKKSAMKNAKILVKKCLNAKYKKIHIDTAIVCRDEKNIDRNIIVNRCEEILKSLTKNDLKNVFIVVGTEVPFAGGGDHLKPVITKLESIKKEYLLYSKIFKQKKILKKKPFALVIDPGIGFNNLAITTTNLFGFRKKNSFSKKNNFYFEAHSSDYQSRTDLKRLVENNFKFLKVGPELTYIYSKSIFKMQSIEKLIYTKKLSDIDSVLLSEMNINKKYWKSYYKGPKKKIDFLLFNSYLDRSRYYWNKKKVINSKKILFKNINKLNENLFLRSFNLTKRKLKIKKLLKLSNTDFITYLFLEKVFAKYYSACNFKIKEYHH